MKQYEVVELQWTAPAPEGSHVLVDLHAEITGPDGTKKVKGFYAGNDIYKLRFLPEAVGTYTYSVNGVVSDSGCVQVEPADTEKHGIVRAEGTHLKYADGTWFYPFGTTVYALTHQTNELIDQTISTLASAPFNKIRMCLFPKHYAYNQNEPQYYPFAKLPEEMGWDVHHPDFDFWDTFEHRMKQLDELGMQVDLILFHSYDRWGFSSMPRENDLIYLEYVLRRFSALPYVWWSLANEYDLCYAKTLADWAVLEEKMARDDPYSHLLSNHNCFAQYDYGRPYITHVSMQNRSMNCVHELQQKFGKPVLYDECCYEGNLLQSWGNISGKELTRRFWKVVTTGGYCTHGETFLPEDGSEIVWWAKGGHLIGESPERIAFLRNLVESLPGPIDPLPGGLTDIIEIAKQPEEKQPEMIKQFPIEMQGFVRAVCAMNTIELTRMMETEFEYAGHVGEDAYLYYMDTQCTAHFPIKLPETSSYTVEMIDTWNMTRELVAESVSGEYDVRLPSREYMAILARKTADSMPNGHNQL